MTSRIGVATISQESNSFAPGETDVDAFTLTRGDEAAALVRGTNSEMAGAMLALEQAGLIGVPLLHVWALPAAPLTETALAQLIELLHDSLTANRPLDGVVLNLHGAMAAASDPDADARLIETARSATGGGPVAVSLDLHANVTAAMVETADVVTAYHTDPHIDMASAGARAARFVPRLLAGEPLLTILSKRAMLVPAESMSTDSEPMRSLRARADAYMRTDVDDVSLFPVQPWLDVPELGFGVTVTGTDAGRMRELAEELAERAWGSRDEFGLVGLRSPTQALSMARTSARRPFILADAADSPTAGAAGDSAVMIEALLSSGSDLRAAVTVVDPPAVELSWQREIGSRIEVRLGSALDNRWSQPVTLHGKVVAIGDGPYTLRGASFTGMQVSMGRFSVIRSGRSRVLVSEAPAWTADPESWRHAGIEPDDLDVVVVKSVSDYRPNYEHGYRAVTVDTPGPASPRLERFVFDRAPENLWVPSRSRTS